MIDQWWSYLLTLIGLSGVYLAGRGRKVGWAIGVAGQALWLIYAFATEQYGFIWSALGYAGFQGWNWWKWYRRDLSAAAVVQEEAQVAKKPCTRILPHETHLHAIPIDEDRHITYRCLGIPASKPDVHDAISEWYESDTPTPLHHYLGMTADEYDRWAEGGPLPDDSPYRDSRRPGATHG